MDMQTGEKSRPSSPLEEVLMELEKVVDHAQRLLDELADKAGPIMADSPAAASAIGSVTERGTSPVVKRLESIKYRLIAANDRIEHIRDCLEV